MGNGSAHVRVWRLLQLYERHLLARLQLTSGYLGRLQSGLALRVSGNELGYLLLLGLLCGDQCHLLGLDGRRLLDLLLRLGHLNRLWLLLLL